jgi:DNA-binding response OmpR family regulator
VGTERKTILICDDERLLRELLRASLEDGYRCVDAEDGEAALDLARELRPDLLVLDLMMPGRSGASVLHELRADDALRETPVVVVSAWSHDEARAAVAAAERFVQKPFAPDELRAIVDDLLSP